MENKQSTCFSKALGTSLLSSERLLLIRSRLLFSIICIKKEEMNSVIKGTDRRKQWPLSQHKLKAEIMSLLTPLRLFLAWTCVVVEGDMEP